MMSLSFIHIREKGTYHPGQNNGRKSLGVRLESSKEVGGFAAI